MVRGKKRVKSGKREARLWREKTAGLYRKGAFAGKNAKEGMAVSKSQLEMYIERQEELLKDFNGKIIAVKDGQCLGAFENKLDAYRDMVAKGYKEGEYMIVRCTPGNSEYTSYFANWFVFGGRLADAQAHA
jgi:hypothetical protein